VFKYVNIMYGVICIILEFKYVNIMYGVICIILDFFTYNITSLPI